MDIRYGGRAEPRPRRSNSVRHELLLPRLTPAGSLRPPGSAEAGYALCSALRGSGAAKEQHDTDQHLDRRLLCSIHTTNGGGQRK